MNILLIHNYYEITGGAEVFVREVARALESHGHRVAFFCPSSEESKKLEFSQYYPEVVNFKKGNIFESIMGFKNIVYSEGSKDGIKKLISEFKPNIAHSFATYVRLTPSVLEGCREAGVPVVMSCNDYKHICPNYKLYYRKSICEKCKNGKFHHAVINCCCHNSLLYSVASMLEAFYHRKIDIYRRNVHTFLFASEFMAHKTEEFWGKGTFRWRKLRNPFDSSKYKATYSPDGPILFFGRLIEEKGVDVLIQAAAKVPEAEIRIVGDGPDMKKLQEMTTKLEAANVTFVGPKWNDAMDEELKACRFVVVPSLWHENFPYVINQAFAFGKPVVGSRRGGITELVSDGERGLVYEATDCNALAEAIRLLWHDSELVRRMGTNAKDFSDREFSDDRFYEVLSDIYHGVLG